MIDDNQRKVDYMRLSITDSCNLRCSYCMPNGLNKQVTNLSLDDIKLICSKLSQFGISKVKITGGEPLIHPQIDEIVKLLKNIDSITEVTITTNGVNLDQHIDKFERYGLDGITISIDTLNKQTYNGLVNRNAFDQVIRNIELASKSKLKNVKLNCVPLKHLGDDNIIELINFANKCDLNIRFIEIMPIGIGKVSNGYTYQQMIDLVNKNYQGAKPYNKKLGNGPAVYYSFDDLKINIGFISAVSNKFCAKCNKIRITSDGYLKQCLHYNYRIKLTEKLKTEEGIDEVKSFIMKKPKEHRFLNNGKNIETKGMSEIGG